jgi:DNA-directed RNA polymerase specialized sigma24 family protein
MDELLKYMRALVALQIRGLSNEEDRVRPEILLARSGLPAREIAGLLGKSEAAVAKAIQRSARSGR